MFAEEMKKSSLIIFEDSPCTHSELRVSAHCVYPPTFILVRLGKVPYSCFLLLLSRPHSPPPLSPALSFLNSLDVCICPLTCAYISTDGAVYVVSTPLTGKARAGIKSACMHICAHDSISTATHPQKNIAHFFSVKRDEKNT